MTPDSLHPRACVDLTRGLRGKESITDAPRRGAERIVSISSGDADRQLRVVSLSDS